MNKVLCEAEVVTFAVSWRRHVFLMFALVALVQVLVLLPRARKTSAASVL